MASETQKPAAPMTATAAKAATAAPARTAAAATEKAAADASSIPAVASGDMVMYALPAKSIGFPKSRPAVVLEYGEDPLPKMQLTLRVFKGSDDELFNVHKGTEVVLAVPYGEKQDDGYPPNSWHLVE